ncbi:MAG TPA: hypothetical protein VFC01_00730 [Mycobacterium sp.]|nr:hypothetical protein [Mycobacterium sp.]
MGSRSARFAVVAMVMMLPAVTAAQYLKHRDPKIPRTADGKPNLTAPAPRTADGKPDLSGLWNAVDGRFLSNISQRAGVTAPFTPWAAALFKERQENQGRDRPAGFCLPHTVPTAMLVPNYPWKVVQTPGLTIILFENFTDFRQIFTDGRDFPEERAPTWFGYSLGRWDGDTFVVNTLGFNDKAWLDDGGHPRSEEMKVTERFRRKDVGHLEIEFTFDDPKAYTRPWSATVPFELIPDSEIIENICENEQDIKHIFFDQKNAK